MPHQVTRATIQDVPQLVALEHLCFQSDLLSAAQFRAFIKRTSSEVIVTRLDDTIVGAAVILYRRGSTIARLYSIAVTPHLHGKNIAQPLLDFLETAAKEHGCKEMRLEVSVKNARAIRFYEKNHYHHFADIKHFYENGDDALRMKKLF